MIEVIVSLNGEKFTVLAKGDVYNNELVDYNHAVKAALDAQFLAHPLEPLDTASLVVAIARVHRDTAARDGNFEAE